MSDHDHLLAFLSLHKTSAKDGYLGALLVTDSQGIPQEFRCSQPVKPTAIQKPLYGDMLVPFIGVTLCGIPLINSLKTKPSIVIVKEKYLLAVRPSIECTSLFVQRAGDAIEFSTESQDISSEERKIECESKRFQPIIISPHPEYYDDLELGQEILNSVFSRFDPLEPFARVETAIDILAKQDQRFQ